jgi:hypothetical protein
MSLSGTLTASSKDSYNIAADALYNSRIHASLYRKNDKNYFVFENPFVSDYDFTAYYQFNPGQ